MKKKSKMNQELAEVLNILSDDGDDYFGWLAHYAETLSFDELLRVCQSNSPLTPSEKISQKEWMHLKVELDYAFRVLRFGSQYNEALSFAFCVLFCPKEIRKKVQRGAA